MKLIYFLFSIIILSCTTSGQNTSEEFTAEPGEYEVENPTTKQPERKVAPPVDTIYQTPHFIFIGTKDSFPEGAIEKMGNSCEATASEIEVFCNRKITLNKIPYYLYPSTEEKGLLISNTAHANVFFKENETHAVFNEEFKDNFLQKENELIIRHLLGTPKHWFLENGLSLYFTKNWQKKGYAYWSKLLFQSDNDMPLADLLNDQLYQKESDLVKGAMAGAFVEFLIHTWGQEKFLGQYNSWSPNAKSLQTLQAEWTSYMAKKESVSLSPKTKPYSYWKGFNFAHEGYNIYNGYISQEASHSLQHLKKINSNAVAIVPYSYMDSPSRATFLPFMKHAGSENDESVIHVIHSARDIGIQSLLKPQIWLGHGSWSGFVEMETEEDWDQFFDFYYRWIRHYAMLAEIHGVEALSVGVEFGKATIGHEEEWKSIFKKLRGIYSGQLTYCANWGEEFEQLSFWAELDFIGLNCYYPLSNNQEASAKELSSAFQKVTEKVEKVSKRFSKPIIFTEIGFRPVDYTWKNPHEDHLGRPYNEDAQKMCYEIVLKQLKDKDWCRGILWWKWPSYRDYSQRRKKGFSPRNRAAEGVVKEWFGKK